MIFMVPRPLSSDWGISQVSGLQVNPRMAESRLLLAYGITLIILYKPLNICVLKQRIGGAGSEGGAGAGTEMPPI